MNLKQKLLRIFLLFAVLLISTPVFADDDSEETTEIEVSKAKNAVGNMLIQAVSLMGIPYKWGGNTPATGMDCSGFIRYVFKKSLGINLPRTAREMARLGKRVRITELEPGDLLFFNTMGYSNSHMGMYIGNNQFIQAPRTGDNIKITELDGYWRARFNGAKRIVQANEDDNGDTVIENYQYVEDEALPQYYKHKKKKYYKSRVISRKFKKRVVKKKSTKHHKQRARSRGHRHKYE